MTSRLPVYTTGRNSTSSPDFALAAIGQMFSIRPKQGGSGKKPSKMRKKSMKLLPSAGIGKVFLFI